MAIRNRKGPRFALSMDRLPVDDDRDRAPESVTQGPREQTWNRHYAATGDGDRAVTHPNRVTAS